MKLFDWGSKKKKEEPVHKESTFREVIGLYKETIGVPSTKKGRCGHNNIRYATCINGHVSCAPCYEASKTVCPYCIEEN